MQFDEVMLALFEHVRGFETLPRKRSIQTARSSGRGLQVVQESGHLCRVDFANDLLCNHNESFDF